MKIYDLIITTKFDWLIKEVPLSIMQKHYGDLKVLLIKLLED